jgi:hypothetical protein
MVFGERLVSTHALLNASAVAAARRMGHVPLVTPLSGVATANSSALFILVRGMELAVRLMAPAPLAYKVFGARRAITNAHLIALMARAVKLMELAAPAQLGSGEITANSLAQLIVPVACAAKHTGPALHVQAALYGVPTANLHAL